MVKIVRMVIESWKGFFILVATNELMTLRDWTTQLVSHSSDFLRHPISITKIGSSKTYLIRFVTLQSKALALDSLVWPLNSYIKKKSKDRKKKQKKKNLYLRQCLSNTDFRKDRSTFTLQKRWHTWQNDWL